MRIAAGLSIVAPLLCAAAAFAQQAPPPRQSSPPAEQAPAAEAPANPSDSQGTPAKPKADTAQSEAGEPRAHTSERAPTAARTPAATGQKASNAADKLQLGTATVTGDREQPKVMYVVPWKRSDIGDLGGKPMNSLVDEILAPVDRDVFKREVRYYQTVKSGASQNGAQPAAEQGEK
jgi:hypothetical protein